MERCGCVRVDSRGQVFSGHLTDLLKNMLDMGNLWGPLIGFNIGIELRQVFVIVLSIPVILGFRRLGIW